MTKTQLGLAGAQILDFAGTNYKTRDFWSLNDQLKHCKPADWCLDIIQEEAGLLKL